MVTKARRDSPSGCLGVWPEGEEGVGGCEGMKKEGIDATDAWGFVRFVL